MVSALNPKNFVGILDFPSSLDEYASSIVFEDLQLLAFSRSSFMELSSSFTDENEFR